MLKIRKQQMQEFENQQLCYFQKKMRQHIKKVFPDRYEKISRTELDDLILFGLDQSSRYDIVSEQDVCLYIDLMVMYGKDFDSNPEYKPHTDILSDEDLEPSDKIDRLYGDIAVDSV